MIILLYSLIAAFVSTTLIFSIICLTSAEERDYDTVVARLKNLVFGFSSRKAIRENIKPERQSIAVFWFLAREIVFFAAVIVAILEYFLRVG